MEEIPDGVGSRKQLLKVSAKVEDGLVVGFRGCRSTVYHRLWAKTRRREKADTFVSCEREFPWVVERCRLRPRSEFLGLAALRGSFRPGIHRERDMNTGSTRSLSWCTRTFMVPLNLGMRIGSKGLMCKVICA